MKIFLPERIILYISNFKIYVFLLQIGYVWQSHLLDHRAIFRPLGEGLKFNFFKIPAFFLLWLSRVCHSKGKVTTLNVYEPMNKIASHFFVLLLENVLFSKPPQNTLLVSLVYFNILLLIIFSNRIFTVNIFQVIFDIDHIHVFILVLLDGLAQCHHTFFHFIINCFYCFFFFLYLTLFTLLFFYLICWFKLVTGILFIFVK